MSEMNVILPMGVFSGEERYREAVIRPMTGGTQKKLAQKNIRSDSVKLLNTLLMDCVVSIPGLPRISNSAVNSLFIGDRDFLALEIRKLSKGNVLNSILTCPACKEKLRMESDLDTDIPMVLMDDLEYSVVEGMPQFTLNDPDSDFSATFSFPTGEHQAQSAKYLNKNPVEGMYVMMYNTIVDWNGKGRNEISIGVFDAIDVKLSEYLMNEYQNMLPGPDFQIPADCPYCGEEMKIPLVASDFLFRLRD